MNIVLNGETRSVADGLMLGRLVEDLGYTGKRLAVERNGEIVPKSRHGETALNDGDRLEIVVAVGGG